MFRRARAPAPSRVAPDGARATSAPGLGDRLLRRYRAACYRALGVRLDRTSEQDLLIERLKQAGINTTPGMHRAVELVTSVIASVAALVVGALLFGGLLREPSWYLYALGLGAFAGLVTFVAFQGMLGTRISNRREELDRELPFTLSELSVLASTGTSPVQLFRRMARRDHDPAMTGEFKKVVYKVDIQGKDLITALAETAKESPSTQVREAFWDLGNMIHQGGNLDDYLRSKSEDVLKLKRLVQKEFIDRLVTFVDMYVSLVLIGVLMIAVGAFLIDAFHSTFEGLDANALLLLLSYGIVPLAVVMTATMISMAYAKAE